MSTRTTVFKQYEVTLIGVDGVESNVTGDIVKAVQDVPYGSISAVAVTIPYSRRLPVDTWLRHLRTYLDARPNVSAEYRDLFAKQPEAHTDKRTKQIYMIWRK